MAHFRNTIIIWYWFPYAERYFHGRARNSGSLFQNVVQLINEKGTFPMPINSNFSHRDNIL